MDSQDCEFHAPFKGMCCPGHEIRPAAGLSRHEKGRAMDKPASMMLRGWHGPDIVAQSLQLVSRLGLQDGEDLAFRMVALKSFRMLNFLSRGLYNMQTP